MYNCLYTLIPLFCSLYLLFPVVQTPSWSVFTDPPPYFCSILSFPLVPRVSWLRARGYIPSAFDWLRRTRDPLFRNLYNNNNNDFGHTANSRCTLRKIYLNPIPFPTIVMMIIETCIMDWWSLHTIHFGVNFISGSCSLLSCHCVTSRDCIIGWMSELMKQPCISY